MRALLGQLLHGAQGIEQEMRLDLRAQQAQLRFAQFARQTVALGILLQLQGQRFVLPVAPGGHDRQRHHVKQASHEQGRAAHAQQTLEGHVHGTGIAEACQQHANRHPGYAGRHDQQEFLELVAHGTAVIEPDAHQAPHQRKPQAVAEDQRLEQFELGRQQQVQCNADGAEQQHQLARGDVKTGAAVLEQEIVQLLALDRRQLGQLHGDVAAHPSLHLLRHLGVFQHQQRFLIDAAVPVRIFF
ncbi:hypothetical protein D3C72_1184350 [compost metagenome]